MDKKDAIKIILSCAKGYRNNLENKNVLFINMDKTNRCCFFQAEFRSRHFQHFTGTIINPEMVGSAKDFYGLCIKNQLSTSAFDLAKDGSTSLKLQVLPSLVQIHKKCRMFGDYSETKIKLYTEKLAGTQVSCMGFVEENNGNGFYSPNTVLKEDIRNLVVEQKRVVLVCTKDVKEGLYNTITYQAKNIDYKNIRFPEDLINIIDLDNVKEDF